VRAHIRRPQHAPVPGQFQDVVGLVHVRRSLICALLSFK
jgi:hypothetical protein